MRYNKNVNHGRVGRSDSGGWTIERESECVSFLRFRMEYEAMRFPGFCPLRLLLPAKLF